LRKRSPPVGEQCRSARSTRFRQMARWFSRGGGLRHWQCFQSNAKGAAVLAIRPVTANFPGRALARVQN